MKINKLISSYNHSSRKGRKIEWIVIHYVGGLGGAKDNCQYYAGGDRQASAHYYVGFNGQVWQSVQDQNAAWSVGVDYGGRLFNQCKNANSLNIQMCVRMKVGGNIKNATDKGWYFEDATVAATIELTKQLMKKYNIDADHVVRHYDVCNKWCPAPYCNNNTKHTWTEFKAAIKGTVSTATTEQDNKPWYRVRRTWANAKSQTGAFHDLAIAKENCAAGYSIFDENGKAVYTCKLDLNNLQAKDLANMSEEQKIKTIAPLYQQCQNDTGMLASVGLAQFCLESGYGTTNLALEANNLHGMKCNLSNNQWTGSTWDGVSKYTKKTLEEYTVGTYTTITADFRKYHNCKQSIYDRAAYFKGAMNGKQKRYPNIATIFDAKTQIQAIKNGGYATDSKYVDKLWNIVTRYNLTQYDTGHVEKITSAVTKPTTTTKKQTWYRVQVEADKFKKNAETTVKDIKTKTGFDSFINEETGVFKYKVYCGSFKNKAGAQERVKALAKVGYLAAIKQVLL